MTKRVILAIGLLIWIATSARAQVVGCGDIRISNDIYQHENRKAVALQANMTRAIAPCPLVLETEAWLSGSGARARSGRLISPHLLHYWRAGVGRRHSESKHSTVWCRENYDLYGGGHDEVNVIAPPQPDCSVFNNEGEYYVWSDQTKSASGGEPDYC